MLIDRGAKVTTHPMITVHESRRVKPEYHVEVAGLPCTDIARSTIDAAVWQPWPRFACAQVAAVVQQRLCSAEDLDRAMRYVGRVRHKAHLREAIRDIRGGSQALSEIDLIRLCRRFGLQEPDRQIKRSDRHGRPRYLDAEWKLPAVGALSSKSTVPTISTSRTGRPTCAVSGAVVIGGAQVLRATSVEVRIEPAQIAADLIAIGVPTSCQNPAP